jgi:hypothetical protein
MQAVARGVMHHPPQQLEMAAPPRQTRVQQDQLARLLQTLRVVAPAVMAVET